MPKLNYRNLIKLRLRHRFELFAMNACQQFKLSKIIAYGVFLAPREAHHFCLVKSPENVEILWRMTYSTKTHLFTMQDEANPTQLYKLQVPQTIPRAQKRQELMVEHLCQAGIYQHRGPTKKIKRGAKKQYTFTV